MLESLKDLPHGIDGVKAIGTVSKEDYEQAIVPLLDGARRDARRIRLLYEVGPEFEKFTPGAAWEDAKLGLHALGLFDGCAVVSDIPWIREPVRLAAFVASFPMKVFGTHERPNAIGWLRALSEPSAGAHRLLEDSGVIVVELTQVLRPEDFRALALTADAWIEAHGELPGLVIHAREFPGWESLGNFIRQVNFLRDHHRKVKRIALAADSMLASLVPRVSEHFVRAEIKTFGYGDVEGAIAWAGGGLVRTSLPRSAPARTEEPRT